MGACGCGSVGACGSGSVGACGGDSATVGDLKLINSKMIIYSNLCFLRMFCGLLWARFCKRFKIVKL